MRYLSLVFNSAISEKYDIRYFSMNLVVYVFYWFSNVSSCCCSKLVEVIVASIKLYLSIISTLFSGVFATGMYRDQIYIAEFKSPNYI